MPFKYEINGSVFEFETEPTEEEIDEVAKANQSVQKETVPTQEKQGVLGTVFDVPSASNREAIRANKILGLTGPAAGSIALSGLAGKKAQLAASSGAQRPSESMTFQDEALLNASKPLVEEASKRTGMFAPSTKAGRALIMAQAFQYGIRPSLIGLVQDFATNPADIGLSLGDIISGVRHISKTATQARKLKVAKEAVGDYKRVVGAQTKGISNKANIQLQDRKIADAIDAVVDNKDSLVLGDEVGRLPKNVDEAVTAIDQTKKQVLQKYTELRKQAGQGLPEIDLNEVAKEAVKDQGKTSRIANPKLWQQSQEFAIELGSNGKVSLDDAEEIIRKWNEELKTVYKNNSRSLDDVNMAGVKAKAAKKLRALLDDAVKSETGESYQELKNLYGSLTEAEEQLSKRAVKIASKTSNSLVDLSNKFDSVPIIYGVFTGNIPLAGAGLTQKAISFAAKRLGSEDALINKIFSKTYGLRKPQLIKPVGTSIVEQEKLRKQVKK